VKPEQQASYEAIKGLDKVYLVGGAVRDQLLGLTSHDKDYVVVGASAAQMKALGFIPVGKDFPVFLHPETKDEYALARTERKVGAGYTGFSVDASQTVTLEEDLARRDLSINAMALSTSGELVDPYNGKDDLEHKILRHTTNAFTEDPVRVLRLARFLARYGKQWRIHASTKKLVKQMLAAGELHHLVPERVFKETEKALSEHEPQLYFEALKELGVLSVLFPELHDMVNVPQPPQHHPEGDVFIHTMLAVNRAAQLNFDLATRFATLTHDFSKAVSFQERGDLLGHEGAGIAVIDAFCARLRVPNKLRDLAKLTSLNHLHCHRLFELTPKTLHKVIIDSMNALKQPERFTQFLQACQCDAQGRGPTLINSPYPQREYAQYLLNALQGINTKAVVKQAIGEGKTGPDLSEAVRIAQIQCIKEAARIFHNRPSSFNKAALAAIKAPSK
jgi:tRNA nucleotidyltransferase (CCA-adding enzyme)